MIRMKFWEKVINYKLKIVKIKHKIQTCQIIIALHYRSRIVIKTLTKSYNLMLILKDSNLKIIFVKHKIKLNQKLLSLKIK